MRMRLIAVLAAVILLTAPGHAKLRHNGDLDIVMLNVGQGDCLFLELPNGTRLLVDGGPRVYWKAGSNLSHPTTFITKTYGNRNSPDPIPIHAAIATHSDDDHVDGITGVLRSEDILIKRVYHNGVAPLHQKTKWDASFNPNVSAVKAIAAGTDLGKYNSVYQKFLKGVADEAERGLFRFKRLSAADDERLPKYILGGVKIEILNPLNESINYPNDRGKVVNGESVTFRLTWRKFEALFTGDLNEVAQPVVYERYSAEGLFACDLFKVPHHGSKYQYDPLLAATKPLVSLVPVGSQGTYGHPNEDTLLEVLSAHFARRGETLPTDPADQGEYPDHGLFVNGHIQKDVYVCATRKKLKVSLSDGGTPVFTADL